MSLHAKLDAFKADFEAGKPPYGVPRSVIETMRRATAAMIESGAAQSAKKAGDVAPSFSLKDPENRSTRDRLAPYCMFTDPLLARVGLSESDARRQGVAVRVARLPMSNLLRPRPPGETQGFMKALVGADDDCILGFTMIGSEPG